MIGSNGGDGGLLSTLLVVGRETEWVCLLFVVPNQTSALAENRPEPTLICLMIND